MYDQQRAKRMFSRKDDLYRSELPSLGNYYSTSSVYSYSRTSSADCPEHGGSKKKLTLILTVSIAVVILGVLSIVGVAAYLGVLSKSNSSSSSDSPEESSSYWGNAEKDDLPVKKSRADLDLNVVSPQSADVVGGSWPGIRRGSKPTDRLTTPQRISTSTSRGTPSSFVYTPVTKPYISFPTPKPSEPEDRPIIIRAPPTTAPPDDRYYHHRNRHRTRHPLTNSHALPPASNSSNNVESDTTPDQPNVPELVENASNFSSDLQSNPNNLPSKPVEPTAGHEDFQYERTEPFEATNHGNVHIRNDNFDSRDSSTPNSNENFAPMSGSIYNFDTSTSKETLSSENAKKQITFDRISPEYYDKKPWIPLLNRPNLDKRPRVDLINPPTETASQTYDLTTEVSSVKPTVTTTEQSRHSVGDRVNDSHAEEETSSQADEDLHRSDIPTFTIYIPHIPVHPNASQPEEAHFQRVPLKPTPENVTQKNDKSVEDYRIHEYDYGTSSEEAAARDDYVEDSPSTEDDTRIYKLDADNVDIVPDTLGPAKPITPTIQNLERDKSRHIPDNVTSSEQTGESAQFHSTVDAMNSTVDHLNLMNQAVDKFEKGTEEAEGGEGTTFNPLFPPVRSYVGVNLPLRPKPDEVTEDEEVAKLFLLNEESRKKLKVYAENGGRLPDLTLTTKSSLTKVLSMMMDDKDASKGQSVHVVVADDGNAVLVNASDNNSKSNRTPKLLHRDPKIDTKFNVQTDPVVHVPVPLIPREEGSGKEQSNSTKSTVTVQDSPVYKFILRKGQSVEDLLKEIFNNYTDKIPTTTEKQVVSITVSSNKSTTVFMPPGLVKHFRPIGATNLNLTSTPLPLMSLNESAPSLRPGGSILTTMNPLVKTSTSVVINGDLEACPSNSSFRCESTGKCISGFGRCNGIRDCPDNSDEKGCLCVDLLRAQMLHRKICDGVPDCKDFSDEYQCDWCSPGQYICAGSRACVNRSKICDGKRDCPRGDDENECVKIGRSNVRDYLDDFSPTYHRSGHLMVRKRGTWGKLCLETFSSTVTHWEVKDLARAVCKALTFADFETVERIVDDEVNSTSPYYELVYGLNDTESSESQPEESSSESTPRTSLGFKQTQCKSRQIVEVACQDLQCGTAPRAFTQAARIVGGANALPGEWPWQAALYRDGEYQCGATLISSRWLLSAGHCFYHAQDDFWVARLGTLRRGATVLSPYEQVVRITHVFLHPQYKDVGFVNDVSLLRLEQEVNFTDFVRPVCLPGRDTKIRDGRMCTVVGWGQLFEVGRVFPDTLQEVQLPLISTGECRKRTLFLPLYKLTEEMFCAGYDRGGRDACLGDSGGPLMCPESDGRWSLYGVTSNGYGCARANRPGVYTKVASYLDWIYEKMSQGDTMIHHDKAKICSGHRCPLGECLEKRRLCNGVSDCLDGSDEKHCTWS